MLHGPNVIITALISGICAMSRAICRTWLTSACTAMKATLVAFSSFNPVRAVKAISFSCCNRLIRPLTVPSFTPRSAAILRLDTRASCANMSISWWSSSSRSGLFMQASCDQSARCPGHSGQCRARSQASSILFPVPSTNDPWSAREAHQCHGASRAG